MIRPYYKLNNEEKFKRTVYVGIFSIPLIIFMFISETFSLRINLLATAAIVISFVYQLWRNYKDMNRE